MNAKSKIQRFIVACFMLFLVPKIDAMTFFTVGWTMTLTQTQFLLIGLENKSNAFGVEISPGPYLIADCYFLFQSLDPNVKGGPVAGYIFEGKEQAYVGFKGRYSWERVYVDLTLTTCRNMIGVGVKF